MDRARKLELRALNEKVWDGETNLFAVGKSLDSSLKKNTAFIKRLRTAITAPTLATFIQEIRSLSLHKYLSEIISACYEGLCKLKTPGEIDAGVEITSALHQRFGTVEFTEQLAWLLGKGMATPDKSFLKTLSAEARDKEEKERITRQRALLRVITELWLVGVLKTLDETTRPEETAKSTTGKASETKTRNFAKNGVTEPFPLEVLKDLLGHDREHANLPLLVVFVKAFSWDILGVEEANAVETRKTVNGERTANIAEDQEISTDDNAEHHFQSGQPLTEPELRNRFKLILQKYFEDVKTHIIRDQKAIQSQAKRNAEAYVKSGEVFEDRQANFEKQVKAQERLVSNAQILADAIGTEMPVFTENEDANATTSNSIGLVKTGEYLRAMGDGAGIWEDEEERRFYENLMDLKGKVPAILLEDIKKKKPETDEQVGKKVDVPETTEEATKEAKEADEQSTAIANKTIGAQVDGLIARLVDLNTKDAVDQAAIDFCFLNSKASRNRLIKALTDVPKGRSDLLPNWSRLVATLGRYMPDVPKGLVEYLDAEFRSLQRRKEKDFLGQVRLSNIRYLAELTKFGIVPEHVVFHCLKVSLDDFSRMNIEVMCNLVEYCGRYLFKNPDTSPRMTSFLETLQRKKSVQHLGQTEKMLIDNAIYYVDPPEHPAIEQKERTPVELFIRKLVYVDMTKRNYSKILKQIRRLHWEEVEVVTLLEKVFSKPGKVKYGNIHLLAILLSALYRYHPEFAIKIIDNVVESISFGLEQNDFRFFQRRVAEVKYLAELYNYRMLEHPVIFDAMYKIVTFGHGGPPVLGRINPFDYPDDFFRIRLITTMLDTCGMYFNRGAAGKKLDSFLFFFQYYIHTKTSLPLDIEFAIQDTFSLTRPQWKLAEDVEEATKSFQQAVLQDQKAVGLDKVAEVDEASSGSSSEDERDLDDQDLDGDDESISDEDDVEEPEEEPVENSYSDDSSSSVDHEDSDADPEEDAEFDREYAKMLAESLESRKFEKKQLFDVALPVRAKARENATNTEPANEADEAPSKKMAFSLLTKKGNRQQTRTVELPSDSQFALAMKTQQQAEKEEQQRIKNLVLNYDLQQAEEQEASERNQTYFHGRGEKSDKQRGQRIRRLQLSDVDW